MAVFPSAINGPVTPTRPRKLAWFRPLRSVPGDFSALPPPVIDPTNGAPFQGNMIPPTRLSQQALALMNLYPLPNFSGSNGYNYQIPTLGATHTDAMQLRMNKLIDQKNQLSGVFSFQSTRQSNAQSVRLHRHHRYSGSERQRELGQAIHAALLQHADARLEPARDHGEAVLRKSREHLGAGRHHRE